MSWKAIYSMKIFLYIYACVEWKMYTQHFPSYIHSFNFQNEFQFREIPNGIFGICGCVCVCVSMSVLVYFI